jgi:hypothetical protein
VELEALDDEPGAALDDEPGAILDDEPSAELDDEFNELTAELD